MLEDSVSVLSLLDLLFLEVQTVLERKVWARLVSPLHVEVEIMRTPHNAAARRKEPLGAYSGLEIRKCGIYLLSLSSVTDFLQHLEHLQSETTKFILLRICEIQEHLDLEICELEMFNHQSLRKYSKPKKLKCRTLLAPRF